MSDIENFPNSNTEEDLIEAETSVVENLTVEEHEAGDQPYNENNSESREVVSEIDQEIKPEMPLSNEEVLLNKIEALKNEIQVLDSDLQSSSESAESIQEEFERLQNIQEDFQMWVERRRKSYAWRLQERLKGFQESLEIDESTIRDFSSEESELEYGFAEKTRNWFLKSFLRNMSLTWFLVILILVVHSQFERIMNSILSLKSNSFREFLASFVSEIFGPNFMKYIFYIFLFSILHFIRLLFSYSRRNNEYSQHVAVESARTLAMEKGIYEVRDARERVDSLFPQVSQIISVLSFGLHKPWVVSKASLMFSGSVPDGSAMPASVEISVPTISSNSPVYEELVAKAMNEIQISGWRQASFNKAIETIAQSIGFGQNGMAVRELDEDQRRSGKRQLLLNAANADQLLEQIGDEQIESLTAVIQEKILPTVKANVVSLKPDPLVDLELTGSLLKEAAENVAAWEVKLSEIAGLAAPWSSETFSAAGSSSGKHQKLESVFMASDRVKDLAVKSVETHADVSPGSRPFEVAIRVDFSEWCKPYEVVIFEDFIPTNEEKMRWEQGIHDSENVSEVEASTFPVGPNLL